MLVDISYLRLREINIAWASFLFFICFRISDFSETICNIPHFVGALYAMFLPINNNALHSSKNPSSPGRSLDPDDSAIDSPVDQSFMAFYWVFE